MKNKKYALQLLKEKINGERIISFVSISELSGYSEKQIRRWSKDIENKDIDLTKLTGTSDMKKIKDLKGNPLLLFINAWSIGMTLDRNKDLVLSEFGRD